MTTNTTTTDLKTLTEEHRHMPPPPMSPTPPAGGKKKRGLIWVVFLLAIAAITGYAVWRVGQPGLIQQTNAQQQGRGRGRGFGGGPLPVVAATAVSKAVPVYLVGLGNVTAYYTVSVNSRVTGQLMKVNFKEGDFVQQGQTLIEIDPRPYQVTLEQAEGQLAHDQALLDDAKLDEARYETLLAQDAIPKQQMDTQKALVAQYTGSIKQDQANVDSARLNLVYCNITAPITGVLGLRQIDPGNIIQANSTAPMVVITQLQPITVLFTVPEDSLPQVMKKLRAGAHLPVEAFSRDMQTKLADGELLTVDNQIDPTTGTSKLKAVFQNKDYTLFPQQFVNIRLHVDTLQNQTVIPTVAVQNGQVSPINPTGTFVYVIDDKNVAHLRPITLVSSDQDGADIKSGIAVGERVAVDGADRLQDGSQVRIRAAGEAEREAAADAAAYAARKKAGRKGGRGPGGPNDQKGFKKGPQ